MARIPASATLLLTGRPRDLQELLIAALLSNADPEDDEPMLIVKDSDLERAKRYTLITTVIEEERTIMLTVRAR